MPTLFVFLVNTLFASHPVCVLPFSLIFRIIAPSLVVFAFSLKGLGAKLVLVIYATRDVCVASVAYILDFNDFAHR